MDYFKFFLGILFKVVLPIILVFFIIIYCVDSCHEQTESSPTLCVDFKDIQYKGHTYIYVSGIYSHTLVHAAHCRCNLKK